MFSRFLLLYGIFLVTAKPFPYKKSEANVCGYEKCSKVNSSGLNVHIVPHSHDDVGWLKTVDQYYYGSQNNIQHAGVQYIITSVIRELQKNPERRFIQVESAFFYKWWKFQDTATQSIVKELLNNGQLEMTGGAWSMNDEGATHYQSIIDQFTLGLSLLNDTFGECGRPNIGWQIDPFGHSREMASIFAQLGYDGLFFARLDYRDRSKRMDNRDQELIWRGSANLENTDLFTSVLYTHYSAPSGFCFDILCDDDPIIDDENDPDFNYQDKVQAFADHIINQANTYQTNNIIITMGDDFNYQDADIYFSNIDKLIKGFDIYKQTGDKDQPINVFYSTPSCYVKAVHDEALSRGLKFALKTDDFFPFATDPNGYLTGYFTSRPTSKRFERQSNIFLQVAKQISVLNSENEDAVRDLKEALGVMQHHDAITGTEMEAVAKDYIRILAAAMDKTEISLSGMILNILKNDEIRIADLNFRSCHLANMSYCVESTKEHFVVAIYNPLSRSVSQYVHLPVPSTDFTIHDSDGNIVEYQVTIAPYDFSYTGLNTMKFDLVFLAENLPPLGLKGYRIFNNDPTGKNASVEAETSDDSKFILGDKNIGVNLNPKTGKLVNMTIDGFTLIVENELRYYLNSDEPGRTPSDAYKFSPALNESFAFTDSVNVTTYKGKLFDEVHQVFSSWAKEIIRVYKQETYIEFDWIVGPINKENERGFEVISRFSTEIASNDTFYTDSNGREMLKRIRNYRPTYEYTNEQPTAGNYYPVTSKIVINNEERGIQFAVLNDRAQGGSSLFSGQVELMLHRATVTNGLVGILNETEHGQGTIVRGQHFVTFGSNSGKGKTRAAIEKDLAQRKLMAPWIFLAAVAEGDAVDENLNIKFAGLTRSLPDNVQILTLEPWRDDTILLRLEHVLESNDDINLSSPVTVDLNDLFTYFKINSLRETTLAANQWIEDYERMAWSVRYETDVKGKQSHRAPELDDLNNLKIVITPMQIRTFIATVSFA